MGQGIISESFKVRLQELAGIIEEGNDEKLLKLGFSEPVVKELNAIDEKRALFFGDIITREFAQNNDIKKDNIKEILPVIDQSQLVEFIKSKENQIHTILEWIKSPIRQGEINFREIKTFIQAFEMAENWHNSLNATGIIEDESGEIVKQYPNGFYWINLKTNRCPEEGKAMGHCGTDSRATTLLSLRDKQKSPHVTIAYNADTNTITQIKGRQ